MPSRWQEPFGMAAIEAMACGTPVVALRSGALPEIIDHGVTGFVVDRPDEMAAAIDCARRLDRGRIRAHVAERFDITETARRYVELYRSLLTTGR
jgi:glycosyltransferase involved in cell wall biosynthesis